MPATGVVPRDDGEDHRQHLGKVQVACFVKAEQRALRSAADRCLRKAKAAGSNPAGSTLIHSQ